MKAAFQNNTLIIESENYTEDLALEYWGNGFFQKVNLNKDVETNPFFMLVKRYGKDSYERKTETTT